MIENDGYAVVPAVLDAATAENLRQGLEAVENEGVSRRDATFAIRNLLDVPFVQELAQSRVVRDLIEPHLGTQRFAVRGIFFDKNPGANWKVPWHQDLSIAVTQKQEVEGFGPWSEKAGAVHVQPPVEVLEKMLTIRLHLDDCDSTNGALRFVPGSHQLGRLSAAQIETTRKERGEAIAEVEQGGVVLMRPLTLHASSPAETSAHRRVVHLEFAAVELPEKLEWLWRI